MMDKLPPITAGSSADVIVMATRETIAPGIGHNAGPTLTEREVFHQRCLQEIASFVKERQVRRAEWGGSRAEQQLGVGRQELGASPRRSWAIIRSIFANLTDYFRQNPLADRTAAVLVIDSLFSDNNEGCSAVSATRLAKLLSCDERTVRRSRESHYQQGLINRETKLGVGQKVWPAINRFLLGESIHPTWWLDATSPRPTPRSPRHPGHLAPGSSGRAPRAPSAGARQTDPGHVTPGYTADPGHVRQEPRTPSADDSSLHSKKEKGSRRPSAEDAMAASLNPEAADVWWTADGRIEVANGFKLELEGAFPGVKLKDGLAIVAGEQMDDDGKPRVRGMKLMGTIRRRFGYLANDNRMKGTRQQRPLKPSRWSGA